MSSFSTLFIRQVTASFSSLHRAYSSVPSTLRDTIFALSSAEGRAAIAVVRLSGPAADSTLQHLLPPGRPLPHPRAASLARLHHPQSGTVMDTALCLRFPGPRSATGEDVVELHVHGGPAVVRCVADALCMLPGVRPAEPGEFTRRAFELGRMDLTEVEGLADLLAAETEVQRQQAVAAAGGAARQQCDAWRAMLLRCLARVEAVIDFGEDDGIGDDVAAGVVKDINALRTELETHLAAASGGELLREGVRVALVGPPNAGKSSLLNTLAGREVAIVSPVAGTTRDVLEVALDLGGYKVWVTDGAGVRGTDDPVEAEGVRRATAAAAAAHVVVNLREPGGAWAPLPELDGDDESQNRRPKPMLRVLSKADLLGTGGMAAGEQGLDCRISCVTGEGLGQLLAILTSAVEAVVRDAAHQGALRGSPTLLNRARHRHHVAACVAALRRYEAAPMALEVAAEELRAAAAALGRVTGAIDTENVLDSIFSEFCIGK